MKRSHRPVLLAITAAVFLGVCGAVASPAVEGDPARLWLERIRGCFQSISSVRARITHQVIAEEGRVLDEMAGTLLLRSDGRIRIDYQGPDRRVLTAHRNAFTAYDARTRTAARGEDRSGLLQGLFTLLWGTPAPSGLVVRHLGGAPAPGLGTGPAALELVPAERRAFFARLVVGVADACPCIRRILVVDRAGRVNRITLGELETGTALPKAAFRLRLPAKTKIIRP